MPELAPFAILVHKYRMQITDFHTHAFPDSLADRAMAALTAQSHEVKAWLDGRVSSLLRSMDEAGIYRSVVCNIATRPEQYEKILAWSGQIRSERIVPLLSVHPADPAAAAKVRQVAAEGYVGIKLHPYYQDFDLDEERVFPIYEALCETGLLLVSHTGFDVAFPRVRKADPVRIRAVLDRFPSLRLVATHLGSWEDWDEVDRLLVGRPVTLEISYSLDFLGMERARDLLCRHPMDRVLFGTDSPWQEQARCVRQVRELGLGAAWEKAVLCDNAQRLL